MKSYEETLFELAAADPRIVVLTAENRAAIRGLPARLGPRFIDVGIAEQTMIGAAAGLALAGRVPVCHALATFLTLRAFEFVRTDVGIGRLPVKLVGGVPGFLSDGNGPTHQALEDIALMRGIPGMQVFCPADAAELVELLPAVLASPEPAYIRYNTAAPAVEHTAPFAIGRAEILSEGSDVALLTYGFLLEHVERAARLLTERGLGVRLVNVRSLKPVDERALVRAAQESRLLVTIEDHFRTGGLYSIVAETLLAHGVAARTLPIALEERWFRPATLPRVLEHEGFTGERLAERVSAALEVLPAGAPSLGAVRSAGGYR
ncbi:MAG TPA: transketolase C-terminal domain-containing protein [Polyangiaceae bacterium]|nr:transketolase C-terminal domain-containing protein [Polyangiaceae bacterium]